MDNVGAYEAILIAAMAFSASLIGGISGFGTGLILPMVLVPIVGVENVIPLMAVGMVVAHHLLRNVTPGRHSLLMESVVFIGAMMLLVRGLS